MRIPCTIEWLGHKAGWTAAAEYRGRAITVTQQKSFALARRRLKAALENAGASDPVLQVTARMPKAVEADLARYKELATLLPKLNNELEELKLRLAQRLSTELNFSEREVGIWLGVSGAHISAKLRAHTVDSGEFARPSTKDEDEDEDERAVRSTVKPR